LAGIRATSLSRGSIASPRLRVREVAVSALACQSLAISACFPVYGLSADPLRVSVALPGGHGGRLVPQVVGSINALEMGSHGANGNAEVSGDLLIG
jgi:hypothetical protein